MCLKIKRVNQILFIYTISLSLILDNQARVVTNIGEYNNWFRSLFGYAKESTIYAWDNLGQYVVYVPGYTMLTVHHVFKQTYRSNPNNIYFKPK